MIKCKIDIMKTLSENGYTSYYMRKNKIMGEGEMSKLRSGSLPSWRVLNIVCNVCHLQISDVVEFVPDVQEFTKKEDDF